MKTDFIFSRCRKWNTPECPYVKRTEMQLAILNSPYWAFLSEDTTAKLHQLCEECVAFGPTWRSTSKYA